MISVEGLADELLDLGRAIGLISNGSLDDGWFRGPQAKLNQILSNPSQRQAFISLLNALLPPASIPGLLDSETWHPLLGDQPRGNVYLTVTDQGSSVLFGIAADFGNPGSTGVTADVRVALPLVSADSSVHAVAGTPNGPLQVSLQVHLGLKKPPIQLDAISLVASIAPPSATLVVRLENLDLGDGTLQNVVLDPNQLESEAFHVIMGLLKQALQSVAGGVAGDLLGLLGLGADGIPQFPFLELFSNPAALQGWFNSLLQSGTATTWLGHVAGLIGATGGTVNGSGTSADPWRAEVIPFDAQSGLSITLANGGSALDIGVQASLVPAGSTPPGRIDAQAVVASIPIAGTGSAAVLPSASITFGAPGSSGAQLVSAAALTVDSLRAGLRWNGSALQPALELINVTFDNVHYDQLDLTNAGSVQAAAASAVQAAITNALGASAGSHLAALGGLIPPSGDPGSPHLVDLPKLAANPAGAIAALHRAVLLDGQRWSFMLAEIAGLIGLPGAPSGSGTQSDPWRVALGPAAPITLELAAWNAQTSGIAADPQKLRLGLRASAARAPVSFSWLAELLAFDLPQAAAGAVNLICGQHALLLVEPIAATPSTAGFTMQANSFQAAMNWSPGSAISWQAGVTGVTLTSNGTTVGPFGLMFPAAAGFDVSNLPGTAGALGVSVPDLELLLRLMVARAALSWGGMAGFTFAGLLGLHSGLSGFQPDWPVLADPAGAGSLITAPAQALRSWLGKIATEVSASGTPFLPQALNWIQAFLSNSLPNSASLPLAGPSISGSGTYEAPWSLPLLSGAESAEMLVWLEPAGPPTGWASAIAAEASAALDFGSLIRVVQALSAFVPGVADAVTGIDALAQGTAVSTLSTFLASSDGVVPTAAQVPTGGTWTAGTLIQSAHPLEPQDPAAISQISAQIDTMAGGAASARVVLLLGPAFSDHTTWQTLLGAHTSANFNLRVANVNPGAVDLSTVTAALDYYTADLNDDGTGNLVSLSSQIGLVVARIGELRPNLPVTLVAHSTAGVAARVFTAAHPTLVQGLITLGTPHLGSALPFLTDPAVAGAVRFIEPLRPGMPAGAIRDALDHQFAALEGHLPPPAAGALPIAAPYPAGSFAGTPSTETGGRPALAIAGALPGNLLATLTAAASSVATQAGKAVGQPPTHISFGVRARLGLPPAGNAAVVADASLRAGLFRIALSSGAQEPSRPAQFLAVDLELSRPGDWLVGEPGSGAARVRSAEFGLDMQLGGSGSIEVIPRVVLHEASLNGPMLPQVNLANAPAQAQALLGAVVNAVSSPAPPALSPLSALLSALGALNVTVANSDGSYGISTDAFAAIITDPVSFFGPRLRTVLSSGSGFVGLNGPSGGPWTLPVEGLPLEIYLEQGSWILGLRTTPAGSGALTLAPNASLSFDASVRLPAFTPSLAATATIGSFSLTWSETAAGSQLVAQATPWLAPITLVPPPQPAALVSQLNDVLPRLLFSSASRALLEGPFSANAAATAVLGAAFGPSFQTAPLDLLFSQTATALASQSALGSSSGNGLDSRKITNLLQTVNQLAGFPSGPGLTLPAGFQLAASGAGTSTDPVTLQLSTVSPIGGVLGAQLTLSIDRALHPSPGGTLSITTPLAGTWSAVTLTFGVTAAGVSLSIAPKNQTAIQLLPTFSGLGALAAGLEALLPAVLDRLVSSLTTPGPPPSWLAPALSVSGSLGIYDSAGGFAAHADALKALLQADWLKLFNAPDRPAVVTALSGMINALGITPPVTASGATLSWSFSLGGSDAGTIALSAGWDGSGPVASLSATQVKLGNGTVVASLSAGYANGGVECSTTLAFELPSQLGITVSPMLKVAIGSTSGGPPKFNVHFLPLSDGSADGPLDIEIAPAPQVTAGTDTALELIKGWLLPLVGNVVLTVVEPQLSNPLWTQPSPGPTLESVLRNAGILQSGSTTLNHPLPDVLTMVTGAVAGLAAGAGISVKVTSTLTVSIVETTAGKIGLRLSGKQAFAIGSYTLEALFGAPSDWTSLSPNADFGLGFYLFQSSGASFNFAPEIYAAGVGLGLAGADDAPLINQSGFRLGGFNGYAFFDAQLQGGLTVNSGGGGLELLQLGLPLGLATSGGVGGNPVAASLLQSQGGSNASGSGDTQPANPAVDVSAWYWSGPDGDGTFHIQFGGQTGIFWIGVHHGFGPVYIDQLGLEVDSQQVQLLIDGSVKVNGLTAQADELTVAVPYNSITTPSGWTLDLKGLAIGFQAPGITLAGGLLKNPGPPVEYDGMLLIQITQFGFIAVGAYSTPQDPTGNDTYTSLFVFAGVFLVIGLPPVIDITGLGLGVGYNRELIPPTDPNKVSGFLLVEALDNAAAIANDPMGALMSIRGQIPPKRGSLWLAVGLHGTSFVIVNVTAILYVALDRGVTIGILGLARMALPADDTALVSLELALEVTFSPTNGTLLIIAQLTDNSWLLNQDCQLTGGFGYYMSFPDSQFVLTIGGYHPAFQKPPAFPEVPRLGYHWSFLGVVAIKGESYFALTNSCVMAGARMEATYGPDWIQVWFTAYTDFLLSWDPFYYDISAGISVGATFRIQACFIACVDIDITVSIGAQLEVQGPPLHGTATVNLDVASVTVAFGPQPNPQKNFLDWNTFGTKYLIAGDPDSTAVNNHVLTGLMPPTPSGAQPTPGTAQQPWVMTSEFSFQTETRMPAMQYTDFFGNNSGQLASVQQIDIAPMGPHAVTSLHQLTLEGQDGSGGWQTIAGTGLGQFSADPSQFTFTPVISQVSQATYQYTDHDSTPAAAHTLPVLTGLVITGYAVLNNASAVIPISTLVDAGDSRPLPFATLTATIIGGLQAFGTAADILATITAGVTSKTALNAAGMVLSGGGLFSQARAAVGLPGAGLQLLAVRALVSFRSSPPLITPITEGLTMKPVGLPLPPIIKNVLPFAPVPLEAARLRAVMQGRPLPAIDAPPAIRTSVQFLTNPAPTAKGATSKVATSAPRFAPPVPAPLPGARLHFRRAQAAPRPTALGRSGRTIRTAELGWSAGKAHIQAFQNAEAQIASSGVTIPAGTTHIWDVPNTSNVVRVSGNSAVRITFLGRNGRVLGDNEEAGGQQTAFVVPAGCGAVAVTSLGNSGSASSGGLGAVSFSAASPGNYPVAGWQAGNLMPQLNSSTFLGRASCVILAQPSLNRKGKQTTAQGMVRLSQAVVDQSGVETWLPVSAGVVGLILDQQDPTAASQGDLAIAVTGATFGAPVSVKGGARKILLYDVTPSVGADHIVVAVASRSASRLSGIVALPGRAQEWAVRWNGGIPEHIVPDGPLTPDGSVVVAISAPVPVVTGVNPSSGGTAGGNAIVITGSGFTGVTAVNFGTTAAVSFSLVSDTQLEAVIPPGSGTVDITVSNPAGTSAIGATDRFGYAAP
jgi:hypothetical protein